MDFKIDKPRRRRKRNSAITFILFTSTIFAFLICALLLFSYAGQRKKAQQAMAEVEILTEENSKMFTQSQVDSFVEKAKQEFLDKLKSMVENGEGMLTILQRFYPDYVIASFLFQINWKKIILIWKNLHILFITKKIKNGKEQQLIWKVRKRKPKKV